MEKLPSLLKAAIDCVSLGSFARRAEMMRPSLPRCVEATKSSLPFPVLPVRQNLSSSAL